jgi:hypothetical protein
MKGRDKSHIWPQRLDFLYNGTLRKFSFNIPKFHIIGEHIIFFIGIKLNEVNKRIQLFISKAQSPNMGGIL